MYLDHLPTIEACELATALDSLTLLQSLESAVTIVRTARRDSSDCSALWNQVNRVYTYLDGQVQELLATLKDGE